MKWLLRQSLTFFVWFTHRLKRLAIRLTQWTGKSSVRVHPKHLLPRDEEHYWYLKYLSSDDDLLDVGCGNGMNTLKAAMKVRTAVGIELDNKNLEAARELQRQQRIANVQFTLSNASEPLPFNDHRFDKILFFDVLEHIVDRQPLLHELHRVLKVNGTLLLSVPNGETRWRRFLRRAGAFSYSDPDHKIEYSRDGLEKELNAGGFRCMTWLPSVYDTPWVGFFDLLGGFSLRLYKRTCDWKRRRAAAEPSESIGFWVLCQAIPSSERFTDDSTRLPKEAAPLA